MHSHFVELDFSPHVYERNFFGMKSEKAKSLSKGADGYSCWGHQLKEGNWHVWKEKLARHRSSCPITPHISLLTRERNSFFLVSVGSTLLNVCHPVPLLKSNIRSSLLLPDTSHCDWDQKFLLIGHMSFFSCIYTVSFGWKSGDYKCNQGKWSPRELWSKTDVAASDPLAAFKTFVLCALWLHSKCTWCR